MKRLVVFTLCILASCAPAKPPAFSGDLITVMESCSESNTYAYKIGNDFVSKSANGDAILRCLYASDVTLVFHGDPVQMREVAP